MHIYIDHPRKEHLPVQKKESPRKVTYTIKKLNTLSPQPRKLHSYKKNTVNSKGLWKYQTKHKLIWNKLNHQRTTSKVMHVLKNFSDEFIAFGNMMCVKLNEIVELLKNSNDQLQKIFEPLQKDMKHVLEERKSNQQIVKMCESV